MFFKWLRQQLFFAIIGAGAIYFILITGDKRGAVIGGPGHYKDGYLFLFLIAFGFLLTGFGSFTKRSDGSSISAFGLLILIGAAMWVWK